MTATMNLDLAGRIAQVPRPVAVLSREVAKGLTSRQQEILDELVVIFNDGFDHLTMAEIASAVNCSLRTLYSLASSRDELVLIVVDRNLWRLGRGARDAIEPGMSPVEAIRSYLRAANLAVANTTDAFARDTAVMPEAQAINDDHSRYLIDVTEALLDEAVRIGEIRPCNTKAVARAMAGLGREFARPEVMIDFETSPKEAADEVVDIILRGLSSGAPR